MSRAVRGDLPILLPGEFAPDAVEVSHGKFLLRGVHIRDDDDNNPRIFDVLFQDVERISINDHYSGLSVRIADAETKRIEEARIGQEWKHEQMFIIGNNDGDTGKNFDYIVAGYIFWAEVGVHFRSVSPLLCEGRDPQTIIGNIYRA